MDLIGTLQDAEKSPSFVIGEIILNLSTTRNSEAFEVRPSCGRQVCLLPLCHLFHHAIGDASKPLCTFHRWVPKNRSVTGTRSISKS